MRTYGGAWPALVTPFTTDDRVNVTVLRDLVEYFVGKEAGGLYLCGSTGQGIFMSVEERKLVAETVLNQVRGRIPLIVHVGSMSVVDAVALAQHAGQSGADGISSILPPLYRDTRSLRAYFEALAAAVPELPIFPYLFGGPSDAVSLMSGLMRIPNVAGTKYTGPNMYELNQIGELRDEGWTVFSGMDEQCLFAAMSGAGGSIGSTVNIMLGAYQRIRQCHETGDLAQGIDLQFRVNRVITLLHATGFDGALRECLRILGFDCGRPRLPRMPQSEEQRAALRAQLDAVDFAALAAM